FPHTTPFRPRPTTRVPASSPKRTERFRRARRRSPGRFHPAGEPEEASAPVTAPPVGRTALDRRSLRPEHISQRWPDRLIGAARGSAGPERGPAPTSAQAWSDAAACARIRAHGEYAPRV